MSQIEDPEILNYKSVPKVVFGFLMIIGALVFIFWSEADPVSKYQVYQDGPGNTTVLAAPQISTSNENNLVYFSGPVSSDVELRDRQLGVSSKAIKLKRTVLMYQWKEQETQKIVTGEGGEAESEVVYTYSKDWLGALFETLSFKKPIDHETNELRINPSKMLFESNEIVSSEIKVGDFLVPNSVVQGFTNFEKIPVPENMITHFPDEWKPRVSVVNGEYYIGKGSLANPQIGDYRIMYEVIKPGSVVTAIGRQRDKSIVPYISQFNGSIISVKPGTQTLESMFPEVIKGDPLIEWGSRALVIAIAFIGAKVFLSGLVSSLSSILLVGLLVPAVYALQWTVYEMLNYGLLTVSAVSLVLLLLSLKSKITNKAPQVTSRVKSEKSKSKDNSDDGTVLTAGAPEVAPSVDPVAPIAKEHEDKEDITEEVVSMGVNQEEVVEKKQEETLPETLMVDQKDAGKVEELEYQGDVNSVAPPSSKDKQPLPETVEPNKGEIEGGEELTFSSVPTESRNDVEEGTAVDDVVQPVVAEIPEGVAPEPQPIAQPPPLVEPEKDMPEPWDEGVHDEEEEVAVVPKEKPEELSGAAVDGSTLSETGDMGDVSERDEEKEDKSLGQDIGTLEFATDMGDENVVTETVSPDKGEETKE